MMISEIFKKFGNESIEEEVIVSVERGEELKLDKKEDQKKKGCC